MLQTNNFIMKCHNDIAVERQNGIVTIDDFMTDVTIQLPDDQYPFYKIISDDDQFDFVVNMQLQQKSSKHAKQFIQKQLIAKLPQSKMFNIIFNKTRHMLACNVCLINSFISCLKKDYLFDICELTMIEFFEWKCKFINHNVTLTFCFDIDSIQIKLIQIKSDTFFNNGCIFDIIKSTKLKLLNVYDIITIVNQYLNKMCELNVIELNNFENELFDKYVHLLPNTKINNIDLLIDQFIVTNCETNIADSKSESNDDNKDSFCIFVKGVGYGTENSHSWNIDQFIIEQHKNYHKQIEFLHFILNHVTNLNLENQTMLIEMLRKYEIEKYIFDNLHQLFTMADPVAEQYVNQLLVVCNAFIDNNLWQIFDGFKNTFETINAKLKFGKQYGLSDVENKFIDIYTILVELHFNKNSNGDNCGGNDDNSNAICDSQQNDIFEQQMEKYKIQWIDYKIENDSNSHITISQYKKEIKLLNELLFVHKDASIFCALNESSMESMMALITGSKDTPYEHGCFIFNIHFSNLYPHSPPIVKLLNNQNFRINPNLYENGTVCLSLLNTWNGEKSETWNSSTSSVAQILLSIQTMIFNENPYYNEPTFETIHNKNDQLFKEQQAIQYCKDVSIYTIKITIETIKQLDTTYSVFKELLIQYYKLKCDDILTLYNSWIDKYEIDVSLKTELKKALDSIIEK